MAMTAAVAAARPPPRPLHQEKIGAACPSLENFGVFLVGGAAATISDKFQCFGTLSAVFERREASALSNLLGDSIT